MGHWGTGSGVEARAKTIRLGFTWSGKRRRETLNLAPTPANLRAAAKLVAQINHEIEIGVFNYARHFPESPVACETASLTTFKEFADRWLETLTTEHGTAKGYRSSLMQVWAPEIGDKPIRDVRHSDIKVIVAARRAKVSGKTVNNDLIALRGVLDAAVADNILAASPARLVGNLSHQSPVPDPFTLEEMDAILARLREHAPLPAWAWYATAFLTGLRPSEQIIVRWGKLDERSAQLRIDTAVTRGREKGTKTGSVRDVDLTPRAMAAIAAMKPHTFMKGAEAPIFCHPATGRPWTNEQYQRITYFHPALRKLGIRLRDAYQARHTYATIGLMGGIAPPYIARQMGHANTAMLFKVYAKWIDGADKGREAAKLAALHTPPIVPALSPKGVS